MYIAFQFQPNFPRFIPNLQFLQSHKSCNPHLSSDTTMNKIDQLEGNLRLNLVSVKYFKILSFYDVCK